MQPIGSPSEAAQLLLVWLSPSFPVGAYAYSHGLESAMAQGLVGSRAGLTDWLASLLSKGSIRNDIILLAATWRQDQPDEEINALALALQPSAERHLETAQQGTSFAQAIEAAWLCDDMTKLRQTIEGDIAYPVAFAVAARGHKVPLQSACEAFALAFVQNMVSAAIRLSIIGQTDGQRVIAALLPTVRALGTAAQHMTQDDLGGCGLSADLAALEHETLYSRLFRS
jgi:urease accessory protein